MQQYQQHYTILVQLAQGIEAFLETEHGFKVLVPQSRQHDLRAKPSIMAEQNNILIFNHLAVSGNY